MDSVPENSGVTIVHTHRRYAAQIGNVEVCSSVTAKIVPQQCVQSLVPLYRQ